MATITTTCTLCDIPVSGDNTYANNRSVCRRCSVARTLARHRSKPVSQRLLEGAYQRARRGNLPFDITEADIPVPTHCPVLGIPMAPSTGHHGAADWSPTVDKLVPSKGYTKGNVRVISWRANKIKSDASLVEVLAVARYMAANL